MQELYKLKETLCDELSKYASKGINGGAALEIIDKLAHACKNVCKIIEYCEGEGDEMSYDGGSYRSYNGGGSYAGSYNGGYSGRGRSRAMSRYSNAENEMAQKLRELMNDAPNDRVRQSMQNLLKEIEQR